MLHDKPLLIPDLDRLRENLSAWESEKSKRGDMWRKIKNCARFSPMTYPWYTPFVALVTREEQDIANAKKVLAAYLQKLEEMYFCSGLQMHFWCFAFPHAKWSLYFQWLCSIGAYTPEEEQEISETLVTYQFLNFYYGMNTKPEPECVDNQTLSLSLSNAIVGWLFYEIGGEPCEMARIMHRDGLRRLPFLIGSLPRSGYTGEGSAYMDGVIGPAIPITIEFLELFTGETDLFTKSFPPNGTVPLHVVEMVAREWMPGGLLLPWDNYGYQFGTRSTLAYAARKTGREEFYQALEDGNLSYDVGIGWAYDDFVWTLVWQPDAPPSVSSGDGSWYEPEAGACLRSADGGLCLYQIWDDSAPNIPTRCHVNPSMVLFNAYGLPLSADGSPAHEGGERFWFDDTWREVSFLTIGQKDSYNYGNGCGGAHSVVLLDGWEGLRAFREGPQLKSSEAALSRRMAEADTAPLYQEKAPDVRAMRRRSRLAADRFFLVEDLADCGAEHDVAARFVLRPECVPSAFGMKIQTPEGVTLHIFDAENPDAPAVCEAVEGHPRNPDSGCVLADFKARGTRVHRLFAAFPSRTRKKEAYEADFVCIPDPEKSMTVEDALCAEGTLVPLRLPAYMETELAPVRRWWYRKRIAKRPGAAWISLPGGMMSPRLWLGGQEIPLRGDQSYTDLIEPQVRLPEALEAADFVDFVLCTEVPLGHYEGSVNGDTIGLWGGVAMCYPCEEETVLSCSLKDGVLTLRTNLREYREPVETME